MEFDIAVIGGGASGLMSAISAKQTNKDLNIVILERKDRVGKKILATGNGRCNLTNINVGVSNFYGQEINFVDYPLKIFDSQATVEFFDKLGLLCKTEKFGKVYPYSDQASSVLDVLRNEIFHLGIEVKENFDVFDVKKNKSVFKIKSSTGEVFISEKLIIAAGGCASSKLGSNGSGFKILNSLGHEITPLFPALVQLKTDFPYLKSLQGIKFHGKIILYKDNKIVSQEKGEILFTDYGISGPPIFQISKFTALQGVNNLSCVLDLMPDFSDEALYAVLMVRKELLKHLTLENYFTGFINKKCGFVILKLSGIEKLSLNVNTLSENQIQKIVFLIKNLPMKITGTNGFENAQVTAGGALTKNFVNKTMESKLIKNLYAVGEVLDIFGDCGGYNLQWAWSSGYLAGKSAGSEDKNVKNK